MAKSVNMSDQYITVKRLKVLDGIESSSISSLVQAVQNVERSLSTVSGSLTDFWSEISSDNVVDPSEKSLLYKEWQSIKLSYPTMTARALAAGIQTTDTEYTGYVAAYTKLDTYLGTTLKLFDNMDKSTTIASPDIFNKRFSGYYTALDTLQDAIENGRDAATLENSKGYTDTEVAALRQTLTTAQWVTEDVLASGLKGTVDSLSAAAAEGFVTQQTQDRIDSAVASAEESIETLIRGQSGGIQSWEEQTADCITAVVQDLKRSINTVASQSSTEISLKVQDLEKDTWAALQIKEDEIVAAAGIVDEVQAALAVQTDRVSALVTGYGAQAYMTASIGLTWLVSKTMRDYYYKGLAAAQSAELDTDFAAVYEKIPVDSTANVTGLAEWQMLSAATGTQKKTLSNFLKAAGKISSYIALSADQVLVDGTTIFSNGKISEAYIDTSSVYSAVANAQSNAEATATNLANAAQSNAEATATNLANAAQSNAEATATSQRNELATKLGYASYNAMVTAAAQGQTIIDGGYIRTDMIDSAEIFTKSLILKGSGYIESENFSSGSTGVHIGADGSFECVNGKFNGAIDSGPLKLTKSTPGTVIWNVKNGDLICDSYDSLVGLGILDGSYTLTDSTVDGVTMVSMQFSKSTSKSLNNTYTIFLGKYNENIHNYYKYKTYKVYLNKISYNFVFTNSSGGTVNFSGTKTWKTGEDGNTTTTTVKDSSAVSSVDLGSTIYSGTFPIISCTFGSGYSTLRLVDLPTAVLSSFPVGTVYSDNGTLKIVT